MENAVKLENIRNGQPTKVSSPEPINRGIYLPPTANKTIDGLALEWLHKYDIKFNEIGENGLLWCDDRKWLIFPFTGSQHEILAFQARRFNEGDKGKWMTVGNVEDLTHLLGDVGDAIIVVEDIVSAIKVSRHATVMPLFGSFLSLKRLVRLRNLTKKLVLWLDADKYKNAMEFARKAQVLGLQSHVIYTEKDPKECTDDEIVAAIKT